MKSKFLNGILNSTHHAIARSATLARACAKLRNQANIVVGYHLGESSNSNRNGEFRLLDHLAPRCRTFVDVGANVGEWSARLPVSALERAILFEPSSQCLRALRARFTDRRFEVRDAAVSDVVGEADFAEEDGCGEGSALVSEQFANSGTPIRKVKLTTLDAEADTLPEIVDFLKIDTEGNDARVLYGSRRLLVEGRIRFLQFEYNTHWLGTRSTLQSTIQFLEEVGYDSFLVRSSGLHPLDYHTWGEFYRYSNFFACRRIDRPTVSELIGPLV